MRVQRTIGLMLLGLGGLFALGFTVIFLVGWWEQSGDPPLDLSSTLMGIVVFGGGALLLLGLPGLYLFERGQSRLEAQRQRDLRERLQGIIMAHGQVTLDAIARELDLPEDRIKDVLYEMLGEGLFGGYIDWTTRTFYVADAAVLGSTTCPNCGGQRQYVGKGVVKCPYCGVMIFIPPGAGS